MEIIFSICTLVNDRHHYSSFLRSAKAAGFVDNCEFLTVDNTSGKQTDAYLGLNRLIEKSSGRFVILCHQDIVFDFDNRKILEDRLIKLEKMDSNWGVCGVAGSKENGSAAIRITDHTGTDRHIGELPAQVIALDECFLLLKKGSGVRVSRDIKGFHLYGTDICIVAQALGYSSYAINFHIRHLGSGRMGIDYFDSYNLFEEKWSTFMADKHIVTSGAAVFLTGRSEPKVIKWLRASSVRKFRKLTRKWSNRL
tara:strand:+ start:696 stop:1454 length:759 start_codon:yes stop_codon:yes gene_type:complete